MSVGDDSMFAGPCVVVAVGEDGAPGGSRLALREDIAGLV